MGYALICLQECTAKVQYLVMLVVTADGVRWSWDVTQEQNVSTASEWLRLELAWSESK